VQQTPPQAIRREPLDSLVDPVDSVNGAVARNPNPVDLVEARRRRMVPLDHPYEGPRCREDLDRVAEEVRTEYVAARRNCDTAQIREDAGIARRLRTWLAAERPEW
jgi:hypothetical protein